MRTLTFEPKEGDEVLLEARVSVYERRKLSNLCE